MEERISEAALQYEAKKRKIRLTPNNAKQLCSLIEIHGKTSQAAREYATNNIPDKFHESLFALINQLFPDVAQPSKTEDQKTITDILTQLLKYIEDEWFIDQNSKLIVAKALLGIDFDKQIQEYLIPQEQKQFKTNLQEKIVSTKIEKIKLFEVLNEMNQNQFENLTIKSIKKLQKQESNQSLMKQQKCLLIKSDIRKQYIQEETGKKNLPQIQNKQLLENDKTNTEKQHSKDIQLNAKFFEKSIQKQPHSLINFNLQAINVPKKQEQQVLNFNFPQKLWLQIQGHELQVKMAKFVIITTKKLSQVLLKYFNGHQESISVGSIKQSIYNENLFYSLALLDLKTPANEINCTIIYKQESKFLGFKQGKKFQQQIKLKMVHNCEFCIIKEPNINGFGIQQILNACLISYSLMEKFFASTNKRIVIQRFIWLDQILQVLNKYKQHINERDLQSIMFIRNIQQPEKLRYLIYLLLPIFKFPQNVILKLENKQNLEQLFGNYYDPPSFYISQKHKTIEIMFVEAVLRYFLHNKRQISGNGRRKIFYTYLEGYMNFQKADIELIEAGLCLSPQLLKYQRAKQIIKVKKLFTPRKYFFLLFKTSNLMKSYYRNRLNLENMAKVQNTLRQFLEMILLWSGTQYKQVPLRDCEETVKQFKILSQEFKKFSLKQFDERPLFIDWWKKISGILNEINLYDPEFCDFWKEKLWNSQKVVIKNMCKFNPTIILQQMLTMNNQQYRLYLQQTLNKQGNFIFQDLKVFCTNIKLILQKEGKKLKYQPNEIQAIVKKLVVIKADNYDAYQLSQLTRQYPSQNMFVNSLLEEAIKKIVNKIQSQKVQLSAKKNQIYLILGQKCFTFDGQKQIELCLCSKYGKYVKQSLSKHEAKNFSMELFTKLQKKNINNYKNKKKAYLKTFQGQVDLPQFIQDVSDVLVSDNVNELNEYVQFYEEQITKIYLQITNTIENQNVEMAFFNKLYSNKEKIKLFSVDIFEAIVKLSKKFQAFDSKLKSTLKVLESVDKNQEIIQALKYFTSVNQDLKKNKILQQIFKIKAHYLELFDSSSQVEIFMKLEQWNKKNITGIKNLIEQKHKLKNVLDNFFLKNQKAQELLTKNEIKEQETNKIQNLNKRVQEIQTYSLKVEEIINYIKEQMPRAYKHSISYGTNVVDMLDALRQITLRLFELLIQYESSNSCYPQIFLQIYAIWCLFTFCQQVFIFIPIY